MAELSPAQKALVLIGLGAILLALLVLSLNHAARTRVPPEAEVAAPLPQSTPATLAVHVVGAVQRPGVYWLAEGARVSDAIAQAGGFTPQADLASVNLAARVQDGQQIRVRDTTQPPTPPEPAPKVVATPAAAAPPTAPALAPTTPPRRKGPSLDLTRARPISLTTATVQELQTVPGIGPQLAAGIVRYRRLNGAFRSVDDLANVPGFGPERIADVRPYVTP